MTAAFLCCSLDALEAAFQPPHSANRHTLVAVVLGLIVWMR